MISSCLLAFVLLPWVLVAGLVLWIIRPLNADERRRATDANAAVPPPALRAIPSIRATALHDERFCQIWRDTPEDAPLYLAVHQLVARDLVEAIEYAARPELVLQAGALAQAQGSVNALINLTSSLDLARTEPERWTAAGGRNSMQRRRGAER